MEKPETAFRTYLENLRGGSDDWFGVRALCTPEFAAYLLEFHNSRNRHMAQSRADDYGVVMKAGQWRRGCTGVGFDKGLIITNGQHRLGGIVSAGCAQELLFVFNCDDFSRSVEDTHRKRSEADCLTLSGTSADNRLVAMVKRFITGPTSAIDGVSSKTFPIELLRAYLDEFTEEFAAAREFAFTSHSDLAHASVAGCVARAICTNDIHRVGQFCSIAISGICECEGDHAAAYFGRWLAKNPEIRGGGGSARCALYQSTQSALDAFLQERPLKAIRPTSRDIFPIPEARKPQWPSP